MRQTLLLRPRPHYTVFKRKRYCFVPDTATVHTTTLKTITENGSFRKRSPEWNDLKAVLFENAVFLVWTAKTILSENDDVTITTPPGCRPDRRFLVASLLIAVTFSLLTLLKTHLTVLRLLFNFSRKEQDIIKLPSLPALGGTMIT